MNINHGLALYAARAVDYSSLHRMKCPLCAAPCRSMPSHPEAELCTRCTGCSHAFTRPESIKDPERYEPSYFEKDHKRWFEHPNVQHF